MNDVLVQLLVALLSGSGIGAAIVAYITRRTPDAGQQQLSQDAFYTRLDERERLAQQEVRERDKYWYTELQNAHAVNRQQLAQQEQSIDDLERRCVLCEAREQGYKDRIDSLHSTIQQLTVEIERLRSQQRNE